MRSEPILTHFLCPLWASCLGLACLWPAVTFGESWIGHPETAKCLDLQEAKRSAALPEESLEVRLYSDHASVSRIDTKTKTSDIGRFDIIANTESFLELERVDLRYKHIKETVMIDRKKGFYYYLKRFPTEETILNFCVECGAISKR